MLEDTLLILHAVPPSALALLASIVALGFSFVGFVQLSRVKNQARKDGDLLEKRLRIITSGAVGMGEKLVQLEARLSEAVVSQMQAAETEAQFSYTQALKLIESGVDHSVVMSNSGLSESEVNLMELLHQTKADVAQSG